MALNWTKIIANNKTVSVCSTVQLTKKMIVTFSILNLAELNKNIKLIKKFVLILS